MRRIRLPCDPFVECKCADPYNKACKVWKEINENKKYKNAIDFLNENPTSHCHNITIDNSVSIDVIRDAKQMKEGEWVALIQDQSANSEKHREAELKTKLFLDREYKRELKMAEERRKAELESEKLARELAKQFESESRHIRRTSDKDDESNALAKSLSQQFSDEDEEKVGFDLKKWLKENPEILRENQEAEKRREQMRKDEELARKLKRLEDEEEEAKHSELSSSPSSQSTPPSSDNSRKRKRTSSFVSSGEKTKRRRRTEKRKK